MERIAQAVTPAVMVSACGLIALGLDNQVSMRRARSALVMERRAIEAQFVALGREATAR